MTKHDGQRVRLFWALCFLFNTLAWVGIVYSLLTVFS